MHRFLFFALLLLCSACEQEGPSTGTVKGSDQQEADIKIPAFDEQKAYTLIQKQVDFGPRVPQSQAHADCADWILQELKAAGADTAFFQEGTKKLREKDMPIKNIIGVFHPERKKRVLLCAHWDTRAMADQDTERPNEPILGADDGGSGVAVWLEVARLLGAQPLLNVGVDIVFFDVEDQGESGTEKGPYSSQTWCLGSQYWSKNPHEANYTAQFGILLDMVGARGARFPKEGISMKYAAGYVEKVWKEALRLGYSEYFVPKVERQITDDHLFINQIRNIPTLDIINLPINSPTGFGPHWHTHKDNMDIIDPITLKAVGETVVAVLYKFDAGIL